ncbi:uncharacterized protein LOC110826686 [Zootermopsis nevadensis]|uniref:uncharacterized protein LOC110826686 n=1 Tax=Zootermopsis nevadensis TaxID=136037 RepID=UPI000B8ED9BA|nr:uncharacterized protein LOC110826686 [Zootermopsis nevadensis]
MDPPERPSRHRNHDKWRRIIEPAGDSESSEWSSDSDVGTAMSSFSSYQSFEPTTMANGSSSLSTNREKHSSVTPAAQSKQSRDPSSVCHILDSFNYMFDSSGGLKRYEGLDPGAGTSATNYSHLLHHDYAERDANNDRSSASDPLWYDRSMYTSLCGWGQKRQQFMNKPMQVIDCRVTPNTSSISSCGMSNTITPDQAVIQGPDIGSAPASGNNIGQEDGEGWRTLSNIARLNSPSKKPPSLFGPSDSTAVSSADTSDTTAATTAPDCSDAVPGPSAQLQTQAGQRDSTVMSAIMDVPLIPISPPGFMCPPASWYVQKKVQRRCNKQVRFQDNTFQRESCVPRLIPEDCSSAASHTFEDPSEIQVLSMAGPSNPSYAPSPQCLNLTGPEKPPMNESLQSTPDVVEADEGGVEVIMVDDPQPQRGEKRQAGKPQECTDEPSWKRIRDEDEILNQGLIGLLECPVCMEYMGPPIHQCRRGHLVCSTCKPKLPSCPTCRSRFTESRNLAMEKVADKLHYPCKNAHLGCTDTLRLRDKDGHEANCAYRNYRCIMVPPCEWKGQHSDILRHVIMSHPDVLLRGSEHVLEMRLGNLTEQSSQNWFVSALGELFRVNLGAVRGGRVQIFGCVLLLGPSRDSRWWKLRVV